MSGIIRTGQNMFGIGPDGPRHNGGEGANSKLGRNRSPYYGNQAASMMDKRGLPTRAYLRELRAQGVMEPKKRDGDKGFRQFRQGKPSATGQLLGGG
jgi:hypothetical protein